jgi:peptide/nickel transport system substrate-binding protein
LLDPHGLLRRVPLRELTSEHLSASSEKATKAFAQEFIEPERWRNPQQLVGSGPYTLASWQSGQRLTLRRKRQWWADQLPDVTPALQAHPQQLEFHVIPDPATALLALRRGSIDVYPNMPVADFQRLRTSSQASDFNFFTPPSYRMVVLEFNTRRPVLQQAGTRRAVAQLLDVPTLLHTLNLHAAQRSVGLVSPRETWAYYDSLPLLEYAPKQAEALLAQTGWKRQATGWAKPNQAGKVQPLTLQLHYRAGERMLETAALMLQQAAKQIGIPVELQPTESSLLSELRYKGDFDMGLRVLYGNPFSYDLRPLLHTSSIGVQGGNSTGFGTPASDKLLDAIVAADDSTEKVHLLHRLQLLLRQEAPFVVLYYEPNFLAVSKRFTHVRPSSPEPGYDLPAFTTSEAAATAKR